MDPEPTLLHGDLDLRILEARHLPVMDIVVSQLSPCFSSCGVTSKSRTTPNDLQKTSDPYVTVVIAGATIATTAVISNHQNPSWNQHFILPIAHTDKAINFIVKDNISSRIVGTVSIPASRIASEELVEGWFPIDNQSGLPITQDTALSLKMQLVHVDKIPKKWGVDRAYFPERSNGVVTLYQDAHVRDGELPDIEIDGGSVFKHDKCWEDMCHAIVDAQKLIYIVGWSIYHKVKLVREPTRKLLRSARELTLGELLKYKAAEGVKVLLLVWDDQTSHNGLLFKTGGLMQTHDEKIVKFFKRSSVICMLSPRYTSGEGWVKQIVGTVYTHHQKCLLVDTPAPGNNRRITAFLGGLDLCAGRYDTPHHRLFSDLETVFLNDVRNPTFPEAYKGPRQPWHDLHCRIDGPAAYDVLTNFEQRWRKATDFWDFRRFKKSSNWRDDVLLNLENITWIVKPSFIAQDPSLPKENDTENWRVQIFRSIDSNSVKGVPIHEDEELNQFLRKDLIIDKSIHTAYVNAIRAAEHFIYIETRNFIGSSCGWLSHNSAEADNLIPMELALKIASKIRAKERFAVYIIIPMWPEGIPDSSAVQQILSWQTHTMRMMYKIIGKELKSMNTPMAHPQDYLNFYCLGNREGPNEEYKKKTALALSKAYRRFMIYVHSNGLIVDDEFVLLGSAAINQRSMDGSGDTEIAMGAYQPCYTFSAKKVYPHGQVYGFRMSLWAEHLGSLDALWEEPTNLECVQLVNQIADDNWKKYTAEEASLLRGHLLKYPISVDANGEISSRPGYEYFPDVGGKILGDAKNIPDNLTM